MAAKIIQISEDGSTWYSLPTPSGSLSIEGNVIDDSILGQTFRSGFTGIIDASLEAEAIYKGIAGYKASIKKQGTSTATTAEPLSLVSGLTYRVTDSTKDIMDTANTVTVYDDGVDVTSQVETFNYLFGIITFVGGYTVVGDITADFNYFPTSYLTQARSYTLGQTVEAVDATTLYGANLNNGFRMNIAGLREVMLDLEGIYNASEASIATLIARNPIVVEINPDGEGKSVARGYFINTSVGQSGDVGDLESEDVSFSLYVPSPDYLPFSWQHTNDTTIPTAVRIALDAWESQTNIYARYMPEGVNSTYMSGQAVVTDMSLSGEIEDVNRFTTSLSFDGAVTVTTP